MSKELKVILENHKKWLRNEDGGKYANFSCADLSDADLSDADLRRANLRRADLSSANLRLTNLSSADLRGADLSGADLSDADLSGANLSDANLRCADLRGADLSGANLSDANLRCADLSGADLRGADLRGADLSGAVLFVPISCPETGSFIAYKKAGNGYIIRLEVLADAKRTSATGRKCRCNKAKVLSIEDIDGTISKLTSVASKYDEKFIYTVGEIVEVSDFCEDRWNECAPGIHFFITREEAVRY